MPSPFVRRRRLGAELRALRLSRNLTTEQLGELFHHSRMKISRLENAQARPDLAEIMDLLDLLDPAPEKRAQILRIAREAAARGWWDAYGDAMGRWQRLYADLESGAASICEYHPGSMPGLMQLPEFTWSLVERDRAEFQLDYDPDRMIKARSHRQRAVLRPGGPSYEVIFDEVGLRRFNITAELMAKQLCHVLKVARAHPHVTVRVLPFTTGYVQTPWPMRHMKLFTFLDPEDPPMALAESLSTDIVHMGAAEVVQHQHIYETIRNEALSEEESLELIGEISRWISSQTGSLG